MPTSAKVRISVGLTPADHRELAGLAGEAHVSVSWLGERAIAEFLERHRRGGVQLPLMLNDNQKPGTR